MFTIRDITNDDSKACQFEIYFKDIHVYSIYIRKRRTPWGNTTRKNVAIMMYGQVPYSKYIGCCSIRYLLALLEKLDLPNGEVIEEMGYLGW